MFSNWNDVADLTVSSPTSLSPAPQPTVSAPPIGAPQRPSAFVTPSTPIAVDVAPASSARPQTRPRAGTFTGRSGGAGSALPPRAGSRPRSSSLLSNRSADTAASGPLPPRSDFASLAGGRRSRDPTTGLLSATPLEDKVMDWRGATDDASTDASIAPQARVATSRGVVSPFAFADAEAQAEAERAARVQKQMELDRKRRGSSPSLRQQSPGKRKSFRMLGDLATGGAAGGDGAEASFGQRWENLVAIQRQRQAQSDVDMTALDRHIAFTLSERDAVPLMGAEKAARMQLWTTSVKQHQTLIDDFRREAAVFIERDITCHEVQEGIARHQIERDGVAFFGNLSSFVRQQFLPAFIRQLELDHRRRTVVWWMAEALQRKELHARRLFIGDTFQKSANALFAEISKQFTVAIAEERQRLERRQAVVRQEVSAAGGVPVRASDDARFDLAGQGFSALHRDPPFDQRSVPAHDAGGGESGVGQRKLVDDDASTSHGQFRGFAGNAASQYLGSELSLRHPAQRRLQPPVFTGDMSPAWYSSRGASAPMDGDQNSVAGGPDLSMRTTRSPTRYSPSRRQSLAGMSMGQPPGHADHSGPGEDSVPEWKRVMQRDASAGRSDRAGAAAFSGSRAQEAAVGLSDDGPFGAALRRLGVAHEAARIRIEWAEAAGRKDLMLALSDLS